MFVAAAVFAACVKESTEGASHQSNGKYVYTINANLDGTKTDYDSNGAFSWTDNDAISVLFHNGTTNKFFTLGVTSVKSDGSAYFSGTIDEGYTIGASDGDDTDKKIWALYPASENHTYSAGDVSFYVKPSVDFSTEGFSANIPMYDLLTDEGALSFKNLASTYKFTVKNLDARVKKVKFHINNQAVGDGRYALSGSWPIHSEKYINYAYPHNAEDATLTYISNVTNGEAVFYVSSRYWGQFKPIITVMDAGHGDYLLKEFTATTAKQPTSKTAVQQIALTVNTELPVAMVDGIIDEWDGVTAIAGNTTRILEWKYLSDADNLYFLFKVDKTKLSVSGSSDPKTYNWGSYIITGYDTDNDSTSGANTGSGGVNGGFEAMSSVYPWRGPEGSPECFNGVETNGQIACPVGAKTGNVTVASSLEGDYYYVETCVPLDKIGSPNGNITVKHGMNFYITTEAVITVGAAALAPKTATITADDLSVKVGKTKAIGATTNSSAAISYVSNDTGIATVSSDGTVTGVAAGSTTITLSVAAVDGKFTAANKTINVTVQADGIDIDGDFDDWADCENVSTNATNNYRVFKAAYDATNIYLYTKRVTVSGQRYIYYDFDLDNDSTTGVAEGGRLGLEAYMALVLYNGDAIYESPGSDATHPDSSVYANVVCKGTVGSEFTETELSIPRSNLNIQNGDVIKIYSWGNKSADGIASLPITLTISN